MAYTIARQKAILQATVLENKYMPSKPTFKQAEFLISDKKEILFGGAAGGGKSEALLMASLQYIDYPDYAAILFRRTYSDLALPGALIPRSKEWLMNTDAHWSEQHKTWTFPSGATLTFSYLDNDNDIYRYQSSEFQFIAFDELTHFTQVQYTYLFSRLRKKETSKIPLRMRAGSNPGGRGHEWVYDRFFTQNSDDRIFIPSKINDNKHINKVEYLNSLSNLDSVTRMQLEDGDWTVRREGNMFKQEWFDIVDEIPELRKVRYWDLAGTEEKEGKDPDWTAGILMGEFKGVFYILDLRHVRESNYKLQQLINRTARIDGNKINIYMEQEPGSSGKSLIDVYARDVLRGYAFYGDKPTGDKVTRAIPLSAAAEKGNVKILRAEWNNKFLDELCGFPMLAHDDIVDATSGAFNKLCFGNGGIDWARGRK